MQQKSNVNDTQIFYESLLFSTVGGARKMHEDFVIISLLDSFTGFCLLNQRGTRINS